MSLETLQAERDIVRLLYDYAAAVDGRDFDGIAACYWDDAFEDHSPGYCGPVAGYIEWLREIMLPGPVLWHQYGNIKVDVAEGADAAHVDSYCQSAATFLGAGGMPAGWLLQGLRYVDVVARRDGAWRFQQRRVRQLLSIDNGVAQALTVPD